MRRGKLNAGCAGPASSSLSPTLRTHPLTRTRLRSTSLADALANRLFYIPVKPVSFSLALIRFAFVANRMPGPI
jgi:hypothetical protein